MRKALTKLQRRRGLGYYYNTLPTCLVGISQSGIKFPRCKITIRRSQILAAATYTFKPAYNLLCVG